MSADPETIAVYDAKTAQYAAMIDKGGQPPQLTAFIAALPAGAQVLDLGCGTGSAAAAMRDHGLNVSALDASVEMVALAKQRYDLDVTLGTFDDLQDHNQYDGIWANFSLLHAPRADMPRHLEAIARALKSGGLFSLGLKAGTGEARDSLGRKYTYYEEEELKAILTDAGFTVTHVTTGEEAGLSGEIAPWITMDCHA
ncbi:MAG: SAM-dependent methyltransferase [Sulfitobacter sp.]|nr:MAG: SAM-dependent methyltransferase [Sulfitobacter sp.]